MESKKSGAPAAEWLAAGRAVQITSGVLAGTNGVVIESQAEGDEVRHVIAITMLGERISLVVDGRLVELLE